MCLWNYFYYQLSNYISPNISKSTPLFDFIFWQKKMHFIWKIYSLVLLPLIYHWTPSGPNVPRNPHSKSLSKKPWLPAGGSHSFHSFTQSTAWSIKSLQVIGEKIFLFEESKVILLSWCMEDFMHFMSLSSEPKVISRPNGFTWYAG